MTELKKALVTADKAMEDLREAIQHKETLVISEDEEKVYHMLHNKYSDVITTISYMSGSKLENVPELNKKLLKDNKELLDKLEKQGVLLSVYRKQRQNVFESCAKGFTVGQAIKILLVVNTVFFVLLKGVEYIYNL